MWWGEVGLHVQSLLGRRDANTEMAFRVVRQRREARRQAKLDEIFLVSHTHSLQIKIKKVSIYIFNCSRLK